MGLNEALERNFRDLVSPWLKLVFLVLGGYIISSGVLFIFLAQKPFREFTPWAWATAFFAGISSIGVMTFINFKIESDFRWWILVLNIVWISSLVLNRFEKQKKKLSTLVIREK